MAAAKRKGLRKKLLVLRLVLFLFIMAFVMHASITQLMILNKICLASGYDNDVCQHLSQYPEAEDAVQSKATSWTMKLPVFAFIPAAFSTLVYGPLSDVHGRKKIMMIPVIGCTIGTLTMLIQSYQPSLSSVLLYGGSLAIGLGGGLGTFFSTILNYVTDTTPQEHRTEVLSSVMPLNAVGMIAGSLCSGILWDRVGPSGFFLIVLITDIIILVSILFLLKEPPRVVDKEKQQNVLTFYGFWKNVTAGWRVVRAERPGGQQRQLLILIFTGLAGMFCVSADANVVSLYTRRVPFQWTPTFSSYFSASKKVMNIIGTVAVTKAFIKLTGSRSDQGDLTLICLGSGVSAVVSGVMASAPSTPYLFLVPLLITFHGPMGSAKRSLISKLVLPSETGALNAFIAFLNNLVRPLGSVIFVSIYTKTVKTFPGAVFIVIMMIKCLCLLLFLYLKRDFLASKPFDKDKEQDKSYNVDHSKIIEKDNSNTLTNGLESSQRASLRRRGTDSTTPENNNK